MRSIESGGAADPQEEFDEMLAATAVDIADAPFKEAEAARLKREKEEEIDRKIHEHVQAERLQINLNSLLEKGVITPSTSVGELLRVLEKSIDRLRDDEEDSQAA